MNDKQEITELLARYADGVNSHDIEAWAAVWSEDGVYNLNGELTIKGRDGIVELYAKSMASVEAMFQLVHNGTVEVDGDSAKGRWYVTEYRIMDENKSVFVIGFYQDRYARTADGWKFAERNFNQIYLENRRGEMRGTAFPFPATRVQGESNA